MSSRGRCGCFNFFVCISGTRSLTISYDPERLRARVRQGERASKARAGSARRATLPRPLNSPPRESGAGRRAGGRRGRVTRDRSPGGAGTRVHSRCSLRRRQTTGLLHSGPFPPESAPDSREPVTARTWKTSAFVISCRPVGFRMRRGARSFPPPPFSFRTGEKQRRPRCRPRAREWSRAPFPSPAGRHSRSPPPTPARALRAAVCEPRVPSPLHGARRPRGRAGPVGTGQGRRGLLVAMGLASRVEVHVDVAVACQNPAGSSRDRSLPGSSCLFPAPLRRAPGVTLGVGGGNVHCPTNRD